MDPWVTTQIRLAERQGLLTGSVLSPVQLKAVLLCETMDLVRATNRSERELRQAMLATGRWEFADLFPEYVPATDSEEAVQADLESEDQVVYYFPAPGDPNFDPKEAQRLLDELVRGNSSGNVSAAELNGHEHA